MSEADKGSVALQIIGDDGTIATTNMLGAIPSFWGVDNTTIQGVKQAVAISNTKHGLLAAVPIICKGHSCAFIESCPIDPATVHQQAVNVGRCMVEIATILKRFDDYCTYFGVSTEDVVDMGLIRDMIDIEVQILRCDNKIAIDGDFIDMVIAGISNQGKEYKNPALSLASQMKEKLRKERYQIMRLLNSTRADKAKENKLKNDESRKAVSLIAKALQLQQQGRLKPVSDFVVDANYSVDEEDPGSPPISQNPSPPGNEDSRPEEINSEIPFDVDCEIPEDLPDNLDLEVE